MLIGTSMLDLQAGRQVCKKGRPCKRQDSQEEKGCKRPQDVRSPTGEMPEHRSGQGSKERSRQLRRIECRVSEVRPL
jgi:hypothetical protein